jgi:glycosyltransferase involved in cell wall biosynthesis
MAWIISKLTGISWSFTVHRGDIEVNNMLATKVKEANFCRCISHLGKHDVLERTNNSNEKKINVIYMGVNLPESTEMTKKKSTQDERFVFASVGTFKKEKGHKYLLKATSILKDKYPDKFELWLIGSGNLKNSIIKYVSELSLINYVKFLGRMKINDIFELYENHKVHCVILSSIVEGIPVSLMEAMSRKVPVIATNVGAVSELINDGENGYLVESKNSLELAKTMGKIMNYKDVQIKFAENGYLTIDKKFNIKKNVFLLKNAIEDQII